MTETTQAPFFPAPVLAALADPATARDLLARTLAALAGVVDVPQQALTAPTPCDRYRIDELRDHVLGWLQFFAAAFADPGATAARPDPEAFDLAGHAAAGHAVAGHAAAGAPGGCRRIVEEAAADFDRALAGGVLEGRVMLSQSLMDGPAAFGMVLGEYLLHGWDLARAQGLPWDPPEQACALAREFFSGVIAPQYRGGEGGFFAAEVDVPATAPALDRLLGFAGRDPHWTPSGRE